MKKQWIQMMTKKLKQDILNQQESLGLPKLSQVSTQGRSGFYGLQKSEIQILKLASYIL